MGSDRLGLRSVGAPFILVLGAAPASSGLEKLLQHGVEPRG